MIEDTFCVKFTYDSDMIKDEVYKILDDYIRLMVKSVDMIYKYDLRGCV